MRPHTPDERKRVRATKVSDAMLRALVTYYSKGSAPPPGSIAYYKGRFSLEYDTEEPVLLRVPGIDMDPSIIGTDGAASDGRAKREDDIGAWAAVRGDGWALVGTFAGEFVNSHTSEAQGIRYGLRFVPDNGSVLLRNDAVSVMAEIERLSKGGPIREGPIRDWDALNEIVWHTRVRKVRLALQHVQDEEGGTIKDRIPSDPLVGAAHRLSWCARRLRLSRTTLDEEAVQWLREAGGSGARWQADLYRTWHSFRDRERV